VNLMKRRFPNTYSLDKNEVDHLARQRFGKGVKALSKLEASGLVSELLDTYGARDIVSRFGQQGTRRLAAVS
jgi:hypothetical protein